MQAQLGLLLSRKSPKDDFFELRLKKLLVQMTNTKGSAIIANDEIIATCYGNIETGPRAG